MELALKDYKLRLPKAIHLKDQVLELDKKDVMEEKESWVALGRAEERASRYWDFNRTFAG